jgi:hypothetical protein
MVITSFEEQYGAVEIVRTGPEVTPEKEQSLEAFRAYAKELRRKPELQGFFRNEVGIQDSIFLFGDIESEIDKYRHLVIFTASTLDKTKTHNHVEKLMNVLVEELEEELNHDIKNKQNLVKNLITLAYRNLTRNLHLLVTMDGSLPSISLTSDDHGARNDCKASITNILEAASDSLTDEQVVAIQGAINKIIPPDSEESEVDPAVINSIEQLLTWIQTNEEDDSTEELVECLTEGGEILLPRRVKRRIQNAEKLTKKYLQDINNRLKLGLELVEARIGQNESQTGARAEIDFLSDILTKTPVVLLKELNELIAKGKKDELSDPERRRAHEIQIYLGILFNFYQIEESDAVTNANKEWTRTAGTLMENIKRLQVRTCERRAPLNENSEFALESEEVKTSRLMEMRVLDLGEAYGEIEIYLTSNPMRGKEMFAIFEKCIRENIDLNKIFDLFGMRVILNYTSEEILGDEVIQEKILACCKKLLPGNLRYTQKTHRNQLNEGEFYIDMKKLTVAGQTEKSNGFPAVKVYYRQTDGTPGEIQFLPKDTFAYSESKSKASHTDLYSIKKAAIALLLIFSDTEFPNLTHAAKAIVEQINAKVKEENKQQKDNPRSPLADWPIAA